MNDVLVTIGEALIDFIPEDSGYAFYDVPSFSPKVGGAPANVSAAFTKLGGKSRMLTMLGNDPFGRKIERELKAAGIDTRYIEFTDKANTALAFVSLEANGGRTFSFYRKPSADMLYSPENIADECFSNAFALHFCSVSLGDFPMKEAHRKAIEIMHGKKGIVSFDPNLRFNLWESEEALKKAVSEFIPKSDIVKLSEDEIEFVTGSKETEKAFEFLFKKGVKLVLYTCGSNGAYAVTKTQSAFSPACKVKAVDTTGAGDGFAGAFLWKLQKSGVTPETLENISRKTLEECLEFSNRFCGESVMKKGAIASYPTLDEMLKK